MPPAVMEAVYNLAALLFVFVALGFCVFIHELGHFVAAKWRGLHIDAFAIGFRPFWRRKYHGVEYRLGWLPFGGYCEIPQVDASGDRPRSADGRELERARPLDRIITAFAGPLFNVLSGLLIGCFVWYFGMPQDSPKMREITVLAIDPAGPEYAAGLRAGDRIVRLNGEPFFATWSQFTAKLLFTIGEVELEVVRDGQQIPIRYLPKVNPEAPGDLGREGVAWPFFIPLIPVELTPLPDSPALAAGIQPGDIVLTFNGQPLGGYEYFLDTVTYGKGRPIELTLRRRGVAEPVKVTVTPRKLPEGTAPSRFMCGFTMTLHGDAVGIESVNPGSPAEAGGLQAGDLIRRINGEAITELRQCQNLIAADRGQRPTRFSIERGGRPLELSITAEELIPYGIGVLLEHRDHPNPWNLFKTTTLQSWQAVRGIVTHLANRAGWTEQQSSLRPSHLSGPLGIGTVLFTSVKKSSLMTGIYFVVLISFALAIFNLLPIPVLDGGHILFGVVEIITGRPLPAALLRSLTVVFVTLLILLTLYTTFADGRRIYWKFSDDGEDAPPAAAVPGEPDHESSAP